MSLSEVQPAACAGYMCVLLKKNRLSERLSRAEARYRFTRNKRILSFPSLRFIYDPRREELIRKIFCEISNVIGSRAGKPGKFHCCTDRPLQVDAYNFSRETSPDTFTYSHIIKRALNGVLSRTLARYEKKDTTLFARSVVHCRAPKILRRKLVFPACKTCSKNEFLFRSWADTRHLGSTLVALFLLTFRRSSLQFFHPDSEA